MANEWDEGVWDIPNVKANHPEKTIHPSQFPIELVERLVLALTNPGDLVLDPFMGVGSSLVAALLHGRRAGGVDNDEAYVEIAKGRIEATMNGTLKQRTLGTTTYEPSGDEKIAQRPAHWT